MWERVEIPFSIASPRAKMGTYCVGVPGQHADGAGDGTTHRPVMEEGMRPSKEPARPDLDDIEPDLDSDEDDDIGPAGPNCEGIDLTDEVVEKMLAAYDQGDVDSLPAMRGQWRQEGVRAPGPSAGASPSVPAASAPSSPSAPSSSSSRAARSASSTAAPGCRELALAPTFLQRGREALQALSSGAPDAAADEHLLHELVADEIALCVAVADVRRQVLTRLPALVEEPRLMLMMTKSLRDLTLLSNAMVRRVEGALSTASTLRASRRMFAIHHPVDS
jgi:hypothetical protein